MSCDSMFLKTAHGTPKSTLAKMAPGSLGLTGTSSLPFSLGCLQSLAASTRAESWTPNRKVPLEWSPLFVAVHSRWMRRTHSSLTRGSYSCWDPERQGLEGDAFLPPRTLESTSDPEGPKCEPRGPPVASASLKCQCTVPLPRCLAMTSREVLQRWPQERKAKLLQHK